MAKKFIEAFSDIIFTQEAYKMAHKRTHPVEEPPHPDIYKMRPMEIVFYTNSYGNLIYRVMRVPGGWLIRIGEEGIDTFVPYSEEFKNHWNAEKFGI